MNFVTRKGDTLNLENDKKFLVADTISYENEAYLLLVTAPEEFLKNLEVDESFCFAKEIVDKENLELSIELVTDKKLIENLTSLVNAKKL